MRRWLLTCLLLLAGSGCAEKAPPSTGWTPEEAQFGYRLSGEIIEEPVAAGPSGPEGVRKALCVDGRIYSRVERRFIVTAHLVNISGPRQVIVGGHSCELAATDHPQVFSYSTTLHPLPQRAGAYVLRAHANGVVLDEAVIKIE